MENYENLPEISKASPILITGASGFIGRNLAARLRALGYQNLLAFDLGTPPEELVRFAAAAAFVYHLAGVNRPQQREEFYTGNTGLTASLLEALKAAGSRAPILFSSTAQVGNDSDYAISKEEAESAVFAHGQAQGVPVYVYRLPGVFGKWSRPGYNTVVATYCYNIARGLPIEVRDPAFGMPLCYIDDVVDSFVQRLDAARTPKPQIEKDGKLFVGIDPTYDVTLGWLAGTIRSFPHTRKTLALPDLSASITRKLWATYLSFLPQDEYAYPLQMKVDERGSFTEFLRTHEHGQVAINVAKPGIVRGNHWHDTKNEKFLVVSGRAVIRLRALNTTEVQTYEVSAEELRVIDIPPGTTHNIENTGEGDLITVIWASEPFDPDRPDTYYEEV